MAFLMRVGVLCLLLWNMTEEIVGTEICSNNDFSCGDGNCISYDLLCDGDIDCLNSADKQNCTSKQICASNAFRCDNETRCIHISWKCDGDFDCVDHTDEIINCTKSNQVCTSTEFKCLLLGNCISLSWKCDNDLDCADGSDEGEHCHGICRDDQYMCENHECISSSLKCDGNKDCLEGSDENDCHSIAAMTTLSSDPVPSSSTSTGKFIENKVNTDNDHRYSTDMRADAVAEMTTLSSGSGPRSSTSTSMFLEDKVDKDNMRIFILVVLLSVGGSVIVISAAAAVICIIKRLARKRQMPNNKNNSYPMLDVAPNTHTCASDNPDNPTYGITDTNVYEGLDRRGNASSDNMYQQLGDSNQDIMPAHLESQYVNTGTCYQQSHTDRRECSKDNNDENVTQMHPSTEYESL